MGTAPQPSSIEAHATAEVSRQKQESRKNASGLDNTHRVSRRCSRVSLTAIELREIAGPHPIAIEELNKLPPLPQLSLKLVPQEILDRALSVRRFEVVPNRKGVGFLVVTHLRFFLWLHDSGAPKTKIQVVIGHGLSADAIRERVRADIYDAALVDGVPVPALPSIAHELESEFPKCSNVRTMSGKEVIARCFGVDSRRFSEAKRSEREVTVCPEEAQH